MPSDKISKRNKMRFMTGKIRTYIILALLLLCQNIMAQNKTPTPDSPSQTDLGIFALPPLERAVRCIKYYEGWHDIKRNYPYIGFCRMRSSARTSPISMPILCCVQTSPSYVPCFVSMARTHYSLPYLPIMSDPTKY